MELSHSFAIASYLVQAAGIPSPWRATHCRIDGVTKTAHVWITRHPLPSAEKKPRWFNRGLARSVSQAPADRSEMQWRHLNCMDFACQIHTVDDLDEIHHELPWLGQPGLPFSNRLSRQVFTCLAEGMEMSAICVMLNIPFADIWKFKYALDNGQVKFDYTPANRVRACPIAPVMPSTSSQHATNADNVPDITDPVWEQLITGELSVQIKTLSFQLILTKMRQQVSLQQDNDVKLMKLRELHRYVERNERSLGYELLQLRGNSRVGSA